MKRDDTRFRLTLRPRRALVVIPLAMAVALVLTVLASYSNVREVLVAVNRAQGGTFLHAVRQETFMQQGTLDEALLRPILRDQEEAGLRCIAAFDSDQQLLASVGGCTGSQETLARALVEARRGDVINVGERVQMVMRRPPEVAASRTERARFTLLVEFEPLKSRELVVGAQRTLGIGSAASVALIAIAIYFWRLTLRTERLKEQLEHDRRLAALGEMAAVLTHEIRNPLAAMKGHTQLLAEQLDPGTRQRDKADRVVLEAVRLEKLSTDLLSFVRTQQINRADTDPAAVVRQSAEAVDESRIDLDLAGAPARWSLDADMVQQMLTNLLRNALQASGDQGRAEAFVGVEGDRLVFKVRDFGAGVPLGEEERIFEPFHTTRTRGTGLGLAVARRIAALHNGTITTYNHSAGGAVFQVTLPRG